MALTLAIASAILLRPANVKSMVLQGLSQNLNLDAAIDDISVSVLPRPRLTGSGLTLRVPKRPDLPPFVTIARFSMETGLLSAIRKHVDTARVSGMSIAVPPVASSDATAIGSGSDAAPMLSDVVVDRLLAQDVDLRFVAEKSTDRPLALQIQVLEIDDLGFDRRMPFRARLTNPVPSGPLETTGHFGPWSRTNPTQTPLTGTYVLSHADLATMNGIGGTLDSTGHFDGHLNRIATSGEARIARLDLGLGGRPASLTSTFDVVVRGTQGTTLLERVDLSLAETAVRITGTVDNLAAAGGSPLVVDMVVPRGQISDLNATAIDSSAPIMTGNVNMRAHVTLPPGPTPVRERLRMTGNFGLSGAGFADPQMQERLRDVSRRGLGKSADAAADRVMTNLKGQFGLASGVLSFTTLTFQVPGASVLLNGTYAVADGALDFRGTLRLAATMSQAVGGFKSIFLKPFNSLFRKDGAGAVLPIRISGTRSSPQFRVEMGRIMKRSPT
ncbi:MAG: hypothetical protein ABI652_00025 [Acidobacteriota bacterium]